MSNVQIGFNNEKTTLLGYFQNIRQNPSPLISQPYSPPRFPSPVVYKSSLHQPMKSKEEATLNESAVSQKLFSVPRHFQAFCCCHKIAAKKHNLQSSLEILSTNTFFSLEPSKLFIEKYSFAKHNETTHSIQSQFNSMLFCILCTFYSHKLLISSHILS